MVWPRWPAGRRTWPISTRWRRCRKECSSITWWPRDGQDVYVRPLVLGFESRERLEEFTAALQQVIDRHDILRTSLAWEGLAEPVQVVWRQALVPVTEVSCRGGPGRGGGRAGCRGGAADGPGPGAAAARAHRAEPGAGWLALLQIHHLVQDHTALDVVIGEIASGAGRAGRRAARAAAVPRLRGPGPAGSAAARSTSVLRRAAGGRDRADRGVRAHRRARRRIRYCGGPGGGAAGGWRPGCGTRPGRAGCRPATVWHLVWARVLARGGRA